MSRRGSRPRAPASIRATSGPLNRQAARPQEDVMRKALLNSRMIDALTICNALDSAAETMTLRDEAHWAAWLRYFLQELEQNAGSNGAYQDFLERLQDEISSRLESGQW